MQVALMLTETHNLKLRVDPRPAQALPDDGLSPLQREVVAIGRADAEHGIIVRGNGRLAERARAALAMITGQRRAKPLADPRLETLRRFAQRAALGREQIADIRAMQKAGYAAPQIVMAARLARQLDGAR